MEVTSPLHNTHTHSSAWKPVCELQGRHVKDAPGIEWFEVKPESAHELVRSICGGLSRICAFGNQ
jgi:hypothetical protein